MKTAQMLRARSWADSVYLSVGCSSPPVDLHAVARHRQVRRAGLRLIIPRGVLIPISGGFEVFLRDLNSRDLDICAPEPDGTLTPRQRLAFAHEIAHTFFYTTLGDRPTPTEKIKNPIELERLCDRVARGLLVPAELLRSAIKERLGNSLGIDARSVRAFAAAFRVSYEVMLDRLRVVVQERSSTRCILVARKKDDQTSISGSYFGLALTRSLPFHKPYESLDSWIPGLPPAVLNRDEAGIWEIAVRGRTLRLEKLPLRARGDFLLQIDDIST